MKGWKCLECSYVTVTDALKVLGQHHLTHCSTGRIETGGECRFGKHSGPFTLTAPACDDGDLSAYDCARCGELYDAVDKADYVEVRVDHDGVHVVA